MYVRCMYTYIHMYYTYVLHTTYVAIYNLILFTSRLFRCYVAIAIFVSIYHTVILAVSFPGGNLQSFSRRQR